MNKFETIYLRFLLACCLLCPSAFTNELQEINLSISQIRQSKPIIVQLEEQQQNQLIELYVRKGRLLQKDGRLVPAVISYRKALQLGNNNAILDLLIGNIYLQLSQYSRAEPFLNRFCLEPSNAKVQQVCARKLYELHLNYGDELHKISLWDQSIEQYQLAKQQANSSLLSLKAVRNMQQSFFQKGVYHFSQKQFKEASHVFVNCLSPQTTEKMRVKLEKIAGHLFLNTAKHYEKIKEPTKALPFYQAIADYFTLESSCEYARRRIKVLQQTIKQRDTNKPSWLE